MWNGTAQTDQEPLGSSSQRQSNPPHSSKHPPQPMQPVAQDKSSGKLKFACPTSGDATLISCSCIYNAFTGICTLRHMHDLEPARVVLSCFLEWL